MKPFRALSAVEQLAAHLRREIENGNMGSEMPGVAQLVKRLGVGTKTVVAALSILKRDGVLEANGARKRSRIGQGERVASAGLRVRMLLYEENDAHDENIVKLGYQLQERGHSIEYSTKTLKALNFDVERVAKMVEKSNADAWVVQSGSRPILEWFAARNAPAFALFGSQAGLPMASLATLKSPAVAIALHRLVDLGHRRIVMLAREERRKPTPGLFEQRFLEAMERLGIETGAYNLPDWEDNPQGFHRCLESLFRHSPPTALLLSEPSLFFSAQQFLMAKGLKVPLDLSLISLDDSPSFAWLVPQVSKIHNDYRSCVPRMMEWINNLAKGIEDRRETLIHAQFIEGGTIGPARRK